MAFAALVIIIGGRRADTKRVMRFADRQDLSIESVIQLFTSPDELDKELAAQFLQQLSKAIGVPAGRFRPTDRISRELAPVEGWEFDDSLWIVLDKWSAIATKRGLSPNGPFETLDDVISWTCKH